MPRESTPWLTTQDSTPSFCIPISTSDWAAWIFRTNLRTVPFTPRGRSPETKLLGIYECGRKSAEICRPPRKKKNSSSSMDYLCHKVKRSTARPQMAAAASPMKSPPAPTSSKWRCRKGRALEDVTQQEVEGNTEPWLLTETASGGAPGSSPKARPRKTHPARKPKRSPATAVCAPCPPARFPKPAQLLRARRQPCHTHTPARSAPPALPGKSPSRYPPRDERRHPSVLPPDCSLLTPL